jgi:hypothetical protein
MKMKSHAYLGMAFVRIHFDLFSVLLTMKNVSSVAKKISETHSGFGYLWRAARLIQL